MTILDICAVNATLKSRLNTNNNTVYMAGGKPNVTCRTREYTFDEWIATGADVGTTYQDVPTAEVIIGSARVMLNMTTNA